MDATPSSSPSAIVSVHQPAASGAKPVFGLSWRLLVLTLVFVMMAEILILVPSLARHRLEYLSAKIEAAYLIMSALEAAPGRDAPPGQIDPNLRDRLLDQAGMLGMTVLRPNMPPRTLGPRVPPQIPVLYDLRSAMTFELIVDAFTAMRTQTSSIIGVTYVSRTDPRVVVEVVLDEYDLGQDLWNHLRELLAVSIFISVTTAALVYVALQWLAVWPLKRITANMIRFRDDPQDPQRIILPKARGDEVGTAEEALSDMQRQLRALLIEKDRLAGVGFAVTKISHDLKNILAAAQLESDRLEQLPSGDPEVKRITQGLERAIDRAVKLSTSTIRFAREGLPEVRKQKFKLTQALSETMSALQSALPRVVIRVAGLPDTDCVADIDLLQRAIENIVRNAAEAGATEISIRFEASGKDRLVVLSDNGPGLPKKALDNLFVPFSGSAKSGGTGLGLPIAREAMRVQGGELLLRSSTPKGTEFAIVLPVA